LLKDHLRLKLYVICCDDKALIEPKQFKCIQFSDNRDGPRGILKIVMGGIEVDIRFNKKTKRNQSDPVLIL